MMCCEVQVFVLYHYLVLVLFLVLLLVAVVIAMLGGRTSEIVVKPKYDLL